MGCIFYCSGTRQTQQAQQSNTTVQSVNNSGTGPVNTVSTVIWQVQVGCLAWCYDAVENQTATGTDSTVVAVAPPPEVPAPAAPVPAQAPAAPPPSTGARTRDSGGAAVRVLGARLGVTLRDTAAPVLNADRVTAVSQAAEDGNGAVLVSVAAAQTVQTVGTQRVAHSARRIGRHRRAARASRPATAGVGPNALARSSTAQPTLELALVLVLAAAVLGCGRWRRVR